MSLKRLMSGIFIFGALMPLVYSQAYPDRHTTNLEDGWLSCQTSVNPNPVRGNGHWIMYNLGDSYALTTSKIWNFNTPQRINSYNNQSWSLTPLSGRLEDGFKDVIIDLSQNGVDWQEWGRFTIPKATGSSFYEGTFGPDFGGKPTRYILITALSNHGGTCYGLGEVKFNGTIVNTTSIVDGLDKASLEAFPNPFDNETTITLNDFPKGNLDLSLTDVTGKIVKSMQFNVKSEKERIPVSGSDLPVGMYLMKVTNKAGIRTIKLNIIR